MTRARYGIAIALGTLTSLSACHKAVRAPTESRAASVLSVGMELTEADLILAKHRAERTLIAVAPPPNLGASGEIDCFSLPRDRVLCLAYDRLDAKRRISQMDLMEGMSKPKLERSSRRLTEIDLSSR